MAAPDPTGAQIAIQHLVLKPTADFTVQHFLLYCFGLAMEQAGQSLFRLVGKEESPNTIGQRAG